MRKFITEQLKENGKWSIKRLSAIVVITFGLAYEAIGMIFGFTVNDYVLFDCLLFGATAIGLTLAGKHKAFTE